MKNRVLIRLFLSIVFIVATSTAIANEGNCLLKIVAANDLAKTASVYIDGKLEGTLESGELTIFDLDIGNHIITLDGELIEKHELEVVFQSTYESKRVDLEANPGKRAVRITSEPSNAAIRIDNEWLEQKTPWQITLEVGRTYEIELFKELHGSKTQSLLVPRKGEIIFLHAEIPKADPPKKPLLLYPEDKSVHLEERVVELAWESLDDSLQFEIEFDGKGHTTSNNIARFYSLERGKTYFWRVTAVNRYGMKTTSEQYSFTMQPNRLPEITSVYPKNESSDVFADVITLTWEVTDADGDRVTYDVYFGDVFDSLVKVRSNSTLNEHKLQELERGKTYYWKIVAFDSFGAKGEGSLNTFTTIANIPPVIDSSSEVLLKETDRDVLAELKWFCEDPDNKLLLYDVYLGVDKAPSLILSDHYLTTLTKEKLKFGTTYYWQIVARDGHGGISKGPLWEFTTKNPPSYIPSDIVPKMVFVEKGSFTMGDTDGANNEKPIHKVTLTYDFYIGKYETTFDEYDAFCEATGRSRPARDEGWGRGSRPVMNVNWWDAVAYCNWLSEKEDLPKAYDNNGNLLDKDGRITTDPSKVVGYRLPTEAEWEYAARGGNKSKEYKYSGSDNVDEVAWYYSNSGDSTQEVGKKAPNELGIYDMSGNVDEWCSDWYDWWYSSSAQTNPYKSTDGSRRVNRGGSWRYDASYVADRYGDSPTDASSRLGFRIARTVPYEGGNRPPLAPYNPIPSNEANIWTTSVTLSWDSYDPDGDVMTYDVYFDTNANLMTRVSSNQVVNTLNRSNLSYNTTYYWKVVAKDSKVVATEGPVWRFSIQEPPHPTMILVEKGSFEMGDTWGYGASNEKPTHKVTFTYNFYIGKYETTFDEYDAFCETTSRNKPDDEGWGRGIRPVINVSRNDAIAYCNWLSEKEDLPKAYDSNGNLLDKDGNITTDPSKVVGYRLPTEAEWEYASRGGNKSKGYKYFSGSDNVDDVAWYYSNSGSKTQEVGKKAPNELGIYDMSGNAWEWCSDGWYNYTGAPKTNPYNSTAGSYWVIRGGSCYDIATSTRVAYRGRISPSVTFALGFRICRTVQTIVSGPSGTISEDSSTFSWTGEDSDGEIVKYEYRKDGGAWTDHALNTSYTWSGYSEGAHTFEVRAQNKGAYSYIISRSFTYVVVGEMVLVEGGTFTMGDTWGDGESNEIPVHEVTLTYDFEIGKYEMTFDEYDAFCDDTGRSKPEDEGWGRGTRPVMNVSWWDAIAYCNWLSVENGLPVAYRIEGEINEGELLDSSGNVTTDITKVVGYRLPTEAEWEYAACGGNKSKGYKYAGSDNVGDVAWYWQNSGDKYLTGDWHAHTIVMNNCRAQEVGKKAPNELGIYDMSGNVWEWCSDWYGEYSSLSQTNPYNNSGSRRVDRGGSSGGVAASVRVAFRGDSSPASTGYYSLGFRICRTVLYTDESRFVQVSNRPPVISITPRRIVEGEVLTIDLAANSSDPDNDKLSYTLVLGPGTVQGSIYTFRTDFNSAGNYTVVIRADDGKGGSISGSFALEVRDVNGPPLLELSDITVPEGSTYSIDLTEVSSDPDGDTLTYSIVQGIGRIENNNYIVEPDYDGYGLYTVVISASDGKGGQVSSSFDLLVTDTNRAPQFTIPDQTTMSTRTLRLDLREFSSDPDGDYLRYEPVYGPGLLTGSIYSFTPEGLGTSTVMLKASDLKGGETTTTFTITVR